MHQAMTQLERDKRAIRTILQQDGQATRAEIALRAGEGLGKALNCMLRTGEVVTESSSSNLYRLANVEDAA